MVNLVDGLLERLRTRHPDLTPTSVGLVVPGTVLEARGIGVASENLGWREFAFRHELSERLDVPVAFGHDVRAAGIAEFRVGTAAGHSDAVVVTVGTGVAAALFTGGRLHTGRGYAGEIGHIVVASEPRCPCGGQGHLESIASAAAISASYNRLAPTPAGNAQDVLARLAAGDQVAASVWRIAIGALAAGLAQTVSLVAPEVIVVGAALLARDLVVAL